MTRIRPILLATAAALSLGLPARAQETGGAEPRPSRVEGDAFSAPSSAADGNKPAETQAPNAGYKPLLPNQTRAPTPSEATKVDVATVAQGLASPWALEFLPDGRMIVTEKAGKIRIVGKDGSLGQPLAGVPKVDARGQGGLLDIALSPSFASDRLVYISYSEPREKGNGTTVAKAKLVESGGSGKLDGFKVIFRQMPTYDGDKHFGSRLAFAPDGKLFVTVGERSDKQTRGQAQDLSSGLGKVFRIDTDGNAPKDNPFAGSDKAKPEIWSYGHRNVQGAALDGQGRLWTIEHGPRGGDELNRPRPGLNYGWPLVSYGIEYSGEKIGEGITQAGGTVQPVYYWDPVIGPSSLVLYTGSLFPAWKDAFLVGGLVSNGLVALKLDGDKVITEERIPLDTRIRDVKVAPDGAIYALTDGQDGKILKLTPKDKQG
ncbi:PQQ-dependent sugar dehydrogenase [Methylobacterium soli]|uniref:PQQ-dependent sugar dehydrogenase n=1 Tax=Methylobacterium soli TaxID=553447 RepID=A0A6L3SZA5_9HYPH|nr:PQQ-dependent sugar dehydrogenase [Methylobacterium soli]KAB1077477.1 PQQ-dependent sugar dehydrogenase [Methylobacterium soli]GJE41075.1 Aldose sugar dehydrogenase YliI [Methylobacterium soli]